MCTLLIYMRPDEDCTASQFICTACPKLRQLRALVTRACSRARSCACACACTRARACARTPQGAARPKAQCTGAHATPLAPAYKRCARALHQIGGRHTQLRPRAPQRGPSPLLRRVSPDMQACLVPIKEPQRLVHQLQVPRRDDELGHAPGEARRAPWQPASRPGAGEAAAGSPPLRGPRTNAAAAAAASASTHATAAAAAAAATAAVPAATARATTAPAAAAPAPFPPASPTAVAIRAQHIALVHAPAASQGCKQLRPRAICSCGAERQRDGR